MPNVPSSNATPNCPLCSGCHLGVALEDGTFGIYEVWETEDKQALATDVKINQLFPDPKAETPVNNNFGNIVDIIYKYGSIRDFVSFNF